MTRWRPDPTFYPSPRLAGKAPREETAYVALLNVAGDGRPDALGVVDVQPDSPTYGALVGGVDMTGTGDELHHFGWNACSSHLCPSAPQAHVERRYLIVPGIHSSRIHVVDIVAVVVYEKLGLRLLRTMWVNLDLVWAVALIGTACVIPLI